MKLLIDTTQRKKAIVTLENGINIIKEGESALVLIEEILTEQQLHIADLTEITANPGPGSYTGVRVGAAVVNALNFALGREKIILPQYE